MALYSVKISNELLIGLWEIDESSSELLSLIQLTPNQQSSFINIQNEKRKKEWIAVRLLLQVMLNRTDCEIIYSNSGKPSLFTKEYSISHSGKFATLLLCKNNKAGIDIQLMKSEIQKGKDFYLSKKELKQIDAINNNDIIYAYWGAKETLFKYCSYSEIDFKNELKIDSFNWNKSGEITGKITQKNVIELVKLKYEKLDNYMLIYTL
ncbi:MAG: 4'-phosphopantetheinyl transferase superfamily protein [Bacteroidia bacterium]|nr:4'-phosphopantetheinyl transferase superfamily protein [Bacteroidia bacterium]